VNAKQRKRLQILKEARLQRLQKGRVEGAYMLNTVQWYKERYFNNSLAPWYCDFAGRRLHPGDQVVWVAQTGPGNNMFRQSSVMKTGIILEMPDIQKVDAWMRMAEDLANMQLIMQKDRQGKVITSEELTQEHENYRKMLEAQPTLRIKTLWPRQMTVSARAYQARFLRVPKGSIKLPKLPASLNAPITKEELAAAENSLRERGYTWEEEKE
jgi:hypothetical protein